MAMLMRGIRALEALGVGARDMETLAVGAREMETFVVGARDMETFEDTRAVAGGDQARIQILLLVCFAFLFTFLCYMYLQSKTKLLLIGTMESNTSQLEGRLIGDHAEANTGNEGFEIEANTPNNHHEAGQKDFFKTYHGKKIVIINFILELPSAVFDQLSSAKKPHYALTGMLISFLTMFVCSVDLACRGKKERVVWKWGARIPWFYHPNPQINKPFGTLMDIIGLVCGIFQCIFATINYSFIYRHKEGPLRFSVWPLIFAFGLLCSKFYGKQNEGSDTEENRTEQNNPN